MPKRSFKQDMFCSVQGHRMRTDWGYTARIVDGKGR